MKQASLAAVLSALCVTNAGAPPSHAAADKQVAKLIKQLKDTAPSATTRRAPSGTWMKRHGRPCPS